MGARRRGDETMNQRLRGQGAEGQGTKPEDLETEELLRVVGEGLKAAVAGFEELEKRSGAKDDSADVRPQTQQLR